MNNLVEKIKQSTLKERVITGLVVIFLIGCGGVIIAKNHNKSVVAGNKLKVVKADKKVLSKKQLKIDKETKSKADKEAKAEAEKQANLKIKADNEAKKKADEEAKAKVEADKVQSEQAQVQAQAEQQAVVEQSTKTAQEQANQPNYVANVQPNQNVPSTTPPAQNNTGGSSSNAIPSPAPTPAPAPVPKPTPISDDQKWLNAGYIRAPFPEGSAELDNWLMDRGYGGYTGNSEGWIRPY